MADSRGRYSRYTAGNSGGVAGRAPLNGDGGNGRRQRPDDQGTGNRRRRTERRRGRFLWAKLLVAVIFLLLVAVAAAAAGTVFAVSRDLPSIDELKPVAVAQTSFVYDRKGRLIGELHGAENRTVVNSDRIPQVLKNATVAIEDERFYQHHGVDVEGIVRAVFTNVRAGEMKQGASTITAQFVRNAYAQISQEKTLSRKIKEAVISWQLEDRWSKEQILTSYLNTIFYGSNSYGCEAISRTLFHKSVSNLDLPQAALIAGIANAPSYYNPVTNPKACKERRDTVLKAMLDQELVTQEQYDAAVASPLKVFKKPVDRNAGPQQYFLDYVTQELVRKRGQNEVFAGGLRIYTTLDLDWQRHAVSGIKSILYSPSDPSVSLVAIDPRNGYIRAMVGGKNFKTSKFNLAWQGGNQLGSAAKPFTLATAIKQGANPTSTFYTDQNVTVSLPGYGTYPVHGEGIGRADLYKATALSSNSIFVQLGADVGPENVVETMHDMGFTSDLYALLSTTLGTNEVTTLETASAYATFASGGIYRKPQAVKLIKTADGDVIYKAKRKGKRAIPDWVAYHCTKAMEGVIQYGTAAQFGYGSLGRPAAGKTGTTDNHYDAWFCGYTPQLATAVWMGHKDGNIPMYSVHGIPAWGGAWSTRIWNMFMSYALQRQPILQFPMYKGTPAWSTWDRTYAKLASSPSPSPSPSPSDSSSPSATPSTRPKSATPSARPTTPTPVPSQPQPTLTPVQPTAAPTTTVPVGPTTPPVTTAPPVTAVPSTAAPSP